MLNEDELRDALLLVFANKQVRATASSPTCRSPRLLVAGLLEIGVGSADGPLGPAERPDRRRDHRQARPALAPPAHLVHPGHLRDVGCVGAAGRTS